MVIFSCLDCPFKRFRDDVGGRGQLYCSKLNKDIPDAKRSYVQSWCPLTDVSEESNERQ